MPAAKMLRPAVLAAATCLLVALSSAAASAATITACVATKTGVTRIVSAKAHCRRGERKLSWSTTGPAGKNGAAGANGANGAEGKPGASGQGPVYATSDSESVKVGASETTLLTKTIPPGTYSISAKADVGSESATEAVALIICGVVDYPGTIPAGTAKDLDLSFLQAPLGKTGASKYAADMAVPFEATFSSTLTTTLALVCGGSPSAVAGYTSLQALQVSGIL